MNEAIRNHVAKYNEANGWETTEESIVETIREAGKHVWTGNESSRRWWTDCFTVVELDGMLIGYNNAKTTGDNGPEDCGWEFDKKSICEVTKKTEMVEVTTYERVRS